MLEAKKKLTYNIERTDIENFKCYYTYEFSTSQWLEDIDNFEGISSIKHDDFKEIVIDQLVNEFRLSLNNVIFGDPAGREYVEYYLKKENI